MSHTGFAALLIAGVCLASSAATDIPLVISGQPKAAIVVPEGAPKDGPVRFAAEELQRFVQEMSGATLPIVSREGDASGPHIIFRVNESAKRPRHDGYRLRAFGGDVFVEATQPRGALFGAYALLRELGCRWYAPGPVGTIVPSRKTLTIPGNFGLIREPDFERRYPSTGGYAETTRMGYNYTGQAGDDVLAEVRRRDLGIFRFGHLWPTLVTNQYYADGRKPTKMDFTGKEDWLPMNAEGKRVANGQTLCLSNPKALEWFVNNAANWVVSNCRNHDYLSMWSADTWTIALCRCEQCQRKGYNPSDWYLMVHNEIKRLLNERGWKRRFGWIAYHGSKARPEKVGLLDHGAGMDLLYAPRPRGGTSRGPYTADNDITREYRDLLKGWLDFLAEQGYQGTKTVFEYYYDLVLLGPLPTGRTFLIPQPDVMQEDIRFYRDHGFDGFFDCCPPAGSWWPDPEYKWLYAELLWDVDLDLDAAREDFFEHYYGPAAEPMMKARGIVETAMFEKPSKEAVERIRALEREFEAAERLAGGDELLRTRIKAARLHAQYCALAKESEYLERVEKDFARAIEVENRIGKFLDENADFLVGNGFFANKGQLNSAKGWGLNRRLQHLQRQAKRG